VPILVVRFEDLQADQAGCLERILTFLCEDKPPPSVAGSLEQLREKVASLSAAQPLYRPRAAHLKAHLEHFNPAQYQYVSFVVTCVWVDVSVAVCCMCYVYVFDSRFLCV